MTSRALQMNCALPLRFAGDLIIRNTHKVANIEVSGNVVIICGYCGVGVVWNRAHAAWLTIPVRA